MRKAAAIVVLVIFAAGAAMSYIPWLTSKGPEVDSTPSLQGITSLAEVKVRAGQQACIRPVPLDPGAHRLQMLLHARGPRASELDVTVRQPGYVGRARFQGYAITAATATVTDLSQPPPKAGDGEVCLRNRGPHAVSLVGTSEPESLTLPVTYVDGKIANDIDPAMTFLQGERSSIRDRLGRIFDRAAGFTGAVPAWLLWPLALLFFVGMPLGAAASLLLAARCDGSSGHGPFVGR